MVELIVFKVIGMKCGGCEKAVEEKLAQIEGVVTVNASHQTDKVKIHFDTDKLKPAQLQKCLAELDYQSTILGG